MSIQGQTVTPFPTVPVAGNGLGEVDRYTVPHSLEWERVAGHDLEAEAIALEFGWTAEEIDAATGVEEQQ